MRSIVRTTAVAAGSALALGLAALPSLAAERPDIRDRFGPRGATPDAVFHPSAPVTVSWTRADALKIDPGPEHVTPTIPTDFPIISDDLWIWDTWPLTNLEMEPVAVGDWNVIFSLTAPRDIPFPDRHSVAEIGYFYSDDAQNWIYGGPLFPEGTALGQREWAGSMLITGDDEVHAFYTASGHDEGPNDPDDVLQRIAYAPGEIHADDEGVWFTGLDEHEIIAEADGRLYQTLEQSQGGPIIYAFRDPFVFRDPVNQQIYMLFSGNNAGQAGSHTCDRREIGRVPGGHEVPADARYYTGNIAIASLRGNSADDFTEWRLLPPLISGECVNQQLERPHIVIEDGNYYMWVISHAFTFAPGLEGPDGLYGWVGPGLRSNYEPLNESGLVLGNPPEAPLQNYSHYVMPNLLVESFVNQIATDDGDVYGGTLAPTLELWVDGDEAGLESVLPYGYIPAMAWVPEP